MKNNEIKNKLSVYFDEDLLNKVDNQNIKKNKDLISSIYEQIHDKNTRKKYAQFFTHKELVQFILSHIPIKKSDTILDPACGAGAFLIEAINKVNPNNVYGIDIDKRPWSYVI